MASFRTPGVFIERVFLKADARLDTGVPAFVGFASGAVNTPVALHRKDELATRLTPAATSFLGDAVDGFFDNGGTRCYVVAADPDPLKDPAAALSAALDTLGPLTDLDLVAVPDAMLLGNDTATVLVQRHTIEHCARHGDRFAILDAVPAATPAKVLAQRSGLTIGQAEPVNAALYHPWLKIATGTGELRAIPPSGHVAGVFARTDARVGVFKAPANEEVIGAIDLDPVVDADVHGELNPEGINCLRAFPGRPIRVFGARTLSRQDEWRYVSVRRLFLTVRRWLDSNMVAMTFEANGPQLWVRIRRKLTVYLTDLWRNGALAGQTADEAFFVKCDIETNPPESRDSGMVVTEIGLAPTTPSEFIVVRIIQRDTTLATV